MAKARVNKKIGPVVELPECPVCLDTMSAPIFQCQSGHSLCNSCTKNLLPPICPICRQTMTQMRNWQLEDLISKATINCPNKPSGCNYKTGNAQMDNHIKECIFRTMSCPLGIFGRCSWAGGLRGMLDHFKDSHPQNMFMNTNREITINNISVTSDDRFVYILSDGKMIFILTIKIDITQKVAFLVVQQIGCQKVALQHIYEIVVTSLSDKSRKVIYYDHCFSDAIDTSEIFRLSKCCVMPLQFLSHFINQKKLIFNINVTKNQPAFTKEPNAGPQKPNPNALNKNSAKFRGKSPSPMTHGARPSGKNNQDKKK